MTTIAHWIHERLSPLADSSFVTASHRRTPEAIRRIADVKYYSVPVATGVSASVLVTPLNKSNALNTLVILCHGLGDDCVYPMWHWIDALVSEGVSVLSVDWDGHGAGGAALLDFQEATRSLPLLLQKLYGQSGATEFVVGREGPQCFLMGHSTGAAFALIAATRPDVVQVVRGVIAVSPAVSVNPVQGATREALSFLNPFSWIRDLWSKIPYYGFRGLFPAAGRYRRQDFPIRLRVGIDYTEQVRSFVNETFEVRRVLRGIQVPVLWLHGARDMIAPTDKVMRLMEEIPSGLFSHIDYSRGHLQSAFSHQIPQYAAKFIRRFQGL